MMHQIRHPLAGLQGKGVGTPGAQAITKVHYGGVRRGDHIEITIMRSWRT
jgi:hypothetical protein